VAGGVLEVQPEVLRVERAALFQVVLFHHGQSLRICNAQKEGSMLRFE
jgi:hypothetical protein